MTDLFTEALKDAEKLREIAEQDAKNRLIEKLTPYIKRVIAKEVAGSTDFFFEQDEEPELVPPPSDPQGMGGPMATTAPANTTDPTQVADVGLADQPMAAPIPGPEGGELVGASMPDQEGKIVVDFDDLFVDAGTDQVTITPGTAPVQPTGAMASPEATAAPAALGAEAVPAPETAVPAGAAPAPVAPTGEEEEVPPLPAEAVSYKEYNRVLSYISERIDKAYFVGNISDISRNSIKQRLFDLMEALDGMRNKGLITSKQARLNENRLEFLFLKLKEAGLDNSYLKKEQGKGTDMTSLREFAAKLFEEDENLAKDSVSTGETGVKVDDEYSRHAADVSGVDPKLGGRKDLKAAQEDKLVAEEMKGGTAGSVNADSISGDVHELPWNEGEPVVAEEDQDKTVTKSMKEASGPDAKPGAHKEVSSAAMGFGDTTEEPCAEFEVDDAELAEAVRSIRKENIKKKLDALREASDGKDTKSWEDGEPEGGEDESHDNLKDKKNEGSKLKKPKVKKEGMYEMDMDMDADVGGEEAVAGDLVLSIDLPPEVEEELAALGVDDLDVDVALNVGGAGDEGDEEVELVDDEDMGGEEGASAEEDMVLADDADDMGDMEEMAMPEGMMESKSGHLARKTKLLEKKLSQALRMLEEKEKQVEGLNKQLAETNLFTSKAVYYSKFLQRALSEKALTKKSLQQIVEHLDKGTTVAETKAIYTKIKRRLDEHATASRKLGGSSSKVTKPGSASLTEGAQPQTGHESEGPTPNRWQVLAGIKKVD